MVTTAIVTKPDQGSDQRIEQRHRVLVDHGATATEVIELLAYNQNIFVQEQEGDVEPEPHVAAWQGYLAEAAKLGVWESLRRRLVQLQFPVQLGISETLEYRSSTRRGLSVPLGTVGLELRSPQLLELFIHESWAGPIPVIFAGDRSDFELLVQALLRRNEPVPIPAAMGASMVAGFNNWDRIRSYRNQWESEHGAEGWDQEWQRLIPQKMLYQDRLMILSDSPYSNVAGSELGMAEDVWRRQSRQIRLEHESIHYWTKRRLGAMQNKVLDELLADYWGLVATTGEYRADWFLRFLGLEAWPLYRSSGRLGNYRGNPELSGGAWKVLQSLVVMAAQNLERAHGLICQPPAVLENARCLVQALSCLTLEEIAMTDAVGVLTELALNFKNKLVRI
jgi:hypothetical protein